MIYIYMMYIYDIYRAHTHTLIYTYTLTHTNIYIYTYIIIGKKWWTLGRNDVSRQLRPAVTKSCFMLLAPCRSLISLR